MATKTGTAGKDTLVGTAGADLLQGLGNDDTLTGGAGNDRLEGGDGRDVASYATATQRIVVNLGLVAPQNTQGAGTDFLIAIESVIGGLGNDILTGNTGANRLVGGGGRDRLLGVDGNDVLVGGADADSLSGGNGRDTLQGGTDRDTLTGGAGDDVLDGGAGADILAGGTGLNVFILDNVGDIILDAFAGNNEVNYFNFSGFDVVAGIRAVAGDDGDNSITVSDVSGADKTLTGNGGEDLIIANSGNDTIFGGDGSDSIDGGAGNDVINGGSDFDIMLGGAGNDVYIVDNRLDSPSENGLEGIDTVRSSVDFFLPAGIEVLSLTGTADIDAIGNEDGFGDLLIGNAGDNLLDGLSEDDTLEGGAGNDILDGDVGVDTMSGGLGNDIFFVDNALDLVFENSAEGVDTLFTTIDYNLENAPFVEILILNGPTSTIGFGSGFAETIKGNTNLNTLFGNGGDDLLLGSFGDDELQGGAGNDRLDGGLDDDLLFGQGGNDTLLGNFGFDELQGGAGNDILVGGGDADRMFGEGGADTFRYDKITDAAILIENTTPPNGLQKDQIFDFVSGVDRLAFRAGAFDPEGDIGLGTLNLGINYSVVGVIYDGTNAGANANHAAGAASFVFSTANNVLYFDPDGADPGFSVIAVIVGATPVANDIAIVA